MKLKYSALALILAVAGCMTSAVAQVTYNFDNVQYSQNGTVDTFTQFLGINNANIVAGYHGANVNKGFTYNPETKVFLNENFPGSAQTQVTAINNVGKSVGFYINSANETFAFEFVNGKYASVGFPSTPFNQFLGQNDVAQSAGYYSTKADGSGPDHPYIYDEAGQTWEAILLPSSVQAQATGMNNSGNVCGFTVDSKNVNHGWLLVTGSLTILNFPGSSGTQALGCNNSGQVVGTYNDAAGNSHGFVYYVTTKKWQSIDDPDGVGTTVVNGINDNGVLVGFYGTSPINTAFVATPEQP